MAWDVTPQRCPECAQIMCEVGHAFLWLESSGVGRIKLARAFVESAGVPTMDVEEASVHLRRPVVKTGVALQVEGFVFQITLVDLVEGLDVLLGLVGNLDGGRFPIPHSVVATHPAIDAVAGE